MSELRKVFEISFTKHLRISKAGGSYQMTIPKHIGDQLLQHRGKLVRVIIQVFEVSP